MTATQLLERIKANLLSEAETALERAETYRASKRQGERNSVPIYVQRGETALTAYEYLETL